MQHYLVLFGSIASFIMYPCNLMQKGDITKLVMLAYSSSFCIWLRSPFYLRGLYHFQAQGELQFYCCHCSQAKSSRQSKEELLLGIFGRIEWLSRYLMDYECGQKLVFTLIGIWLEEPPSRFPVIVHTLLRSVLYNLTKSSEHALKLPSWKRWGM